MKKDLKTKALFLSLISASIFGAKDLDKRLRSAISDANPSDVLNIIGKEETDVNARFKKNKETPLILAARQQLKMLQGASAIITGILLEHGANPMAKDMWGMTALMWAARNDSIEILKELLQYSDVKDNINMQDKRGNTALIHAVRDSGDVPLFDFLEVIKTLLQNGADPNIENSLKKTALAYATDTNRLLTMSLLLIFGAKKVSKSYQHDMAKAAKKMKRNRKDGGPSEAHPYNPPSRQNY